MTEDLLVALFLLPFLAGLAVSLFFRRRRTASVARGVAIVVSAATTVIVGVLLSRAGDGAGVVIEWLPGMGRMTIGLGRTGLYAALVTSGAAFLALLGGTALESESPPLSVAIVLLALAGANVAFLSEHFLARYVALEVVALCVALAPLVEQKGREGGRAFWIVYVILRLGDIGLLTAILILFDASGTLEIAPALEAARHLGAVQLGWVISGLLLAVWVKLGNWPLHLWARYGWPLSLTTQAWLFSVVMPNLGAYLLYRTAPLLAPSPLVQALILWLGAGAAVLAVLIALTQRDTRNGLIYIGAARGGLLVFAAGSGVKSAVWLALLATTPLQLLLFLAGEAPEKGAPSLPGRIVQVLSGLGGMGLAVVGLLITFWARQEGVPLDALFVAEASVALLVVWAVREAMRSRPREDEGGSPSMRWIAITTLGLAVLVGILTLDPLVAYLMADAGLSGPSIPALPNLLRYVLFTPALLLTLILVLAVWRLQRRSRVRPELPGPTSGRQVETAYDLQEGLAEAARALHAVVEVGILEQLITLSVRAVVDGAGAAHRLVEQEGLEGLLRRVVEAALGLSRALRRRHTGRLRHNLWWVPISLAVVLVLTLARW